MSNEMRIELQQVPPPKSAPINENASMLGLVDGLRAACTHRMYRCGCCGEMQKAGTWQVWVPSFGIRKGDPEWAITEACRQNAYNGNFTAWCLKCAPKKSAVTSDETRFWWQFWK